MRFLFHPSVDAAACDAFRAAGHTPATGADVGLDLTATPASFVEEARRRQLELVVGSREALDTFTPLLTQIAGFGRLVVLLRGDEPAAAAAVLFARYKRLKPGRLYTASPTGVKASQLPCGVSST